MLKEPYIFGRNSDIIFGFQSEFPSLQKKCIYYNTISWLQLYSMLDRLLGHYKNLWGTV